MQTKQAWTRAVLRTAIIVDAVVFLTAALLNGGATIPLGFAVLRFPAPVWQAGVGEAFIALALLAAAATERTGLAWVAFWLSVVGIVIGLRSPRVQGLARDVHVILVPLAAVIFGLLMSRLRQRIGTPVAQPRMGSR